VVDMRIPSALCLLLLGGVFGVASAKTLHDPLRPSSYSAGNQPVQERKVEQEPVWRLTAVLISDSRLVAIINGQTVRVGDSLEGYRVKVIERDQVVLVKKDRTIVIKRTGTGLKKPARSNDVNGKEGSAQ